MKKVLLLSLVGLFGSFAYGQLFTSNFETWNDTLPEGWGGSKTTLAISAVKKLTTGTNSPGVVQLINTSTTAHKRFTTKPLSVTDATAYDVFIWAKGKGDIRTGMYDANTNTGTSGYIGYNSYISIDSAQWGEYKQQVIATNTSAIAEFILSIRNTDSIKGYLQIDSIAIVAGVVLPPADASIYDIQYTMDASGVSPMLDVMVNTGGIVSAIEKKGYYMQDAIGAFHGIYMYDSINKPAIGDSITLTGKVTEFQSNTQISNVTNYTKVSSGNTPYAPLVVTTGTVAVEGNEAVLVRVNDPQVTLNLPSGRFNANDGSGDIMVNDALFFYTLAIQYNYYTYITGVYTTTFDGMSLNPRMESDMGATYVGLNEEKLAEVNIYPNAVKDIVTIEAAEFAQVSVIGIDGKVWKTAAMTSALETMNIAELNAGVYIVRIERDDAVRNIRIIKQ